MIVLFYEETTYIIIQSKSYRLESVMNLIFLVCNGRGGWVASRVWGWELHCMVFAWPGEYSGWTFGVKQQS